MRGGRWVAAAAAGRGRRGHALRPHQHPDPHGECSWRSFPLQRRVGLNRDEGLAARLGPDPERCPLASVPFCNLSLGGPCEAFLAEIQSLQQCGGDAAAAAVQGLCERPGCWGEISGCTSHALETAGGHPICPGSDWMLLLLVFWGSLSQGFCKCSCGLSLALPPVPGMCRVVQQGKSPWYRSRWLDDSCVRCHVVPQAGRKGLDTWLGTEPPLSCCPSFIPGRSQDTTAMST